MHTKLAVFASGTGSNFEAILTRIETGDLKSVVVALLISNNSRCGAMAMARKHGVRAVHVSSTTNSNPVEYEKALLALLRGERIDLIALAGYMKLLPADLVRAFARRIINIHPALLPRFGGTGMHGLNVHRAVLAAQAEKTGVTVHYVNESYDQGAVISQRDVPVLKDDTPEVLAARVLEVEHDLYWRVIDSIVNHPHSEDTTAPT